MSSRTVKFGAVGDIMLAGQIAPVMQEKGTMWPFEPMLPVLQRADLLFGNLESVVMPPDYPLDQKDPAALASTVDGSAGLRQAGFDVINLAQNHVLDAGTVSMFHTRDLLQQQGITVGGIGATQDEARQLQIIEKGGIRFGFLCYAEDSNYTLGTTGPCHAWYTRDAVLEDIRRHRDTVDILIVSVHADLEFMETPSVPRRDLFREAVDAGATIVLGHHPHVPQGIERIGKSLIAYSLGNFIFDVYSFAYMRGRGPAVSYAPVLLADVSKDGVEAVERVPGRILSQQDERPVPVEGAEKQAMLDYLDELDRKVLDDAQVQRNWRDIALQHMETYLTRAKHYTPDDLLREIIGRLAFTRENQSWIGEVMNAAREQWVAQASRDYTLHRPHYIIARRDAPPDREAETGSP